MRNGATPLVLKKCPQAKSRKAHDARSQDAVNAAPYVVRVVVEEKEMMATTNSYFTFIRSAHSAQPAANDQTAETWVFASCC